MALLLDASLFCIQRNKVAITKITKRRNIIRQIVASLAMVYPDDNVSVLCKGQQYQQTHCFRCTASFDEAVAIPQEAMRPTLPHIIRRRAHLRSSAPALLPATSVVQRSAWGQGKRTPLAGATFAGDYEYGSTLADIAKLVNFEMRLVEIHMIANDDNQ